MKSIRSLSLAPALMLSLLGLPSLAPAQVSAVPSALNFQGRLVTPSGNAIPDGTHTLRFRFYDALTAGNILYEQTIPNVSIKNGTFAVNIDGFTADKFNGNVWLGIAVNLDIELAPRTSIISVPYAIKSQLALTVPDGSITNSKIAAGTLTADKFASGVLNGASWLLGGNAGTNPATQFLGTTDAQPLVFKTNNTERLRIDASGGLRFPYSFGANPDYVGAEGNFIAFGHPGASEDAISYKNNTFFFKDSPGGGDNTDPRVVVGGNLSIGTDNTTFPLTIGNNTVGDKISLWGQSGDHYGFGIQGGLLQIHSSTSASDIAFGYGQSAAMTETMRVKGNGNVGIGTSTPGAKLDVNGTAKMTGFQMATGAEAGKVLVSDAGGTGTWGNVDWSKIANIPGGLGGSGNSASGYYSVVAGGIYNIASTPYDTVAGGFQNTASGYGSTVAGGAYNIAGGSTSFAAGYKAKANHRGAFVWADPSFDADFTSTGDNQFLIRAGGGVGINTNNPAGAKLNVYGGVNNVAIFAGDLAPGGAAAFQSNRTTTGNYHIELKNNGGTVFYVDGAGRPYGTGSYVQISDARYKHNIVPIENALDSILNLQGVTYEWDTEKWKERGLPTGKQIGFIAQEVEKVLPELVTTDAKGYKMVSYSDTVPVLVEAVKTLNAKVERLSKVEAENAELKSRLDAIERALAELADKRR